MEKDKSWIKSSYWSIYPEVWDFLGFLVCLLQSLHVSQIPEEKEGSTDKTLYMMYDMENLSKMYDDTISKTPEFLLLVIHVDLNMVNGWTNFKKKTSKIFEIKKKYKKFDS